MKARREDRPRRGGATVVILLSFLLGLVVGVALCGALFLAACYVEARAVATPPRYRSRLP